MEFRASDFVLGAGTQAQDGRDVRGEADLNHTIIVVVDILAVVTTILIVITVSTLKHCRLKEILNPLNTQRALTSEP